MKKKKLLNRLVAIETKLDELTQLIKDKTLREYGYGALSPFVQPTIYRKPESTLEGQ